MKVGNISKQHFNLILLFTHLQKILTIARTKTYVQ